MDLVILSLVVFLMYRWFPIEPKSDINKNKDNISI